MKVSGIFDNYIENALVVNAATLKEQNGQWKPDTLLVRTTGTQSQVQNADRISGEEAEGAWTAGKKTAESLAEQIQAIDGVTTVLQLSDTRKTADRALACVHYIVLLLVLFSGALQFLVIYNLTSINLEERSREIATIEVLGFYPKETDRYVLSENLVLSVIAGFIGLPLGALFHHAVMDRIVVANMVFDIHIRPVSYLFSLIVTVSFAAVVNLFMRRQIRKIPMAESLKAVE